MDQTYPSVNSLSWPDSGETSRKDVKTFHICFEPSSDELSVNIKPEVLTPLMKDPQSVNQETHSSLKWSSVEYIVKSSDLKWDKNIGPITVPRLVPSKKVILQPQSGQVNVGNFIAVIGPSGAGKSTLLECLSGRRRKKLTGDVFISSQADLPTEDLTVGFISQRDHLLNALTVKESIIFASRLRNHQSNSFVRKSGSSHDKPKSSTNRHERLTQNLLKQLNLEACADTLAGKCSGGQMKRLSIALELISKPRFLVLDEPTSGLDSSSALQCIAVLKNLTTVNPSQDGLGILASIHQPSASILEVFDSLYILSYDGRCIYNGKTSNLVPYLSSFNLTCPQFHNPADYIVEVAASNHGADIIINMAAKVQNLHADIPKYRSTSHLTISEVVDKMSDRSFPFFLHSWFLSLRFWKIIIREPLLSWIRFVQHILLGLTFAYMINYQIGRPNGCLADVTTSISSADALSGLQKKDLREQTIAADNASFQFYSLLFLVFGNSMATVLTFPFQIAVFIKEKTNGWYNSISYYTSNLITDLPFHTIPPIVYSAIMYFITGQIASLWRFSTYCAINVIVSSIAQNIGIIFGIIFVENPSAAALMTPVAMTPFFALGGFFVSYSGVTAIFKPITILSFIRYAFEAVIVVIYGFGRCPNVDMQDSIDLKSSVNLVEQAAQYNVPPQMMALYSMAMAVSKLNITADDSEWLSAIFGVDSETCMQNILSGLANFEVEETALGDSPISNTTYSQSYMMAHWDFTDNDLWTNSMILISMLIVLRIIAYVALVYKANRKS